MRKEPGNNILAIAFVAALCVHGLILGAPEDIFSFLYGKIFIFNGLKETFSPFAISKYDGPFFESQ